MQDGSLRHCHTLWQGSIHRWVLGTTPKAGAEAKYRNRHGQWDCQMNQEWLKLINANLDKVSRRAVITGATNIILGGKSIIQTGRFPSSFLLRFISKLSRCHLERRFKASSCRSTCRHFHGSILLDRWKFDCQASREDIQRVCVTLERQTRLM